MSNFMHVDDDFRTNVPLKGSMVERVAQALHNERGRSDWPLSGCESCTSMAHAAIAAMREPTEKMLWRVGMHKRDAWTRAWQAMIDAGLEGE